MLRAGALGQPRGMVRGGRREEGSGWETHVYLWRIHVDIWQNQYNFVKLKNKKKGAKTNKQTWKTNAISKLIIKLLKSKNCCVCINVDKQVIGTA